MEDIQAIKQRFEIIGNNPGLNRAIDIATQVAPTDLSVLITGESGVGKEIFPRIIHAYSTRKHAQYIAVNCGAIPEGTIDSELFGHEKGAFTGAVSDRKGYFEVTDGGTIFLDEVGELPLPTQARLLRVLETGEFIRVGSSKVQKTNVRVIAATNLDIPQAVKNGKFREDLYYRLNAIPITIPPLRERKEDIPLLFRKFAADFAEKYRMPAMLLADGTMGQMMEPVQLPEARDPDTTEKDWAVTGTKCQRKHHVVNSLYLSPAELERLNIERFERYAEIEKNECMWEAFMMEDAEVCIVSCGITARVSRNAIVEARKQGIKAGMIRPITLWPFPKAPLRKAADQVKRFVCVELNMGQMREDVQLAVACKKPVDLCFRVGGMIPSPDEVLDAIRKANEGGND